MRSWKTVWKKRGPTISRALIMILIMSVILPVLYTLADPPSRGQDVCDQCHGGGFDLVIEDPTFSLPATIDKGESKQVIVTVDVSADGTNAYWEFDMTVRLRSVNSKVTVSSAQVFRNQRPAGSSQPYSWTRDVTFTITGKNGGTDTIRAEAVIDPDHYVNAVTRSSTNTIIVNNQPPTISSGYVSPLSGPQGTGFDFGVTYSDANGDVPSYVRVRIGTDQYSLSPDDGVPDSVATGELYTVSGLVLDEGSHQFHFEASDGDDQVRYPSSGEMDGPEVLHVNSAPLLQNNYLDPVTGYSSDLYTFKVIYSDEEDQAPVGGVFLILNGGQQTEAMILDAAASPHLRDGVYTNGETYSITISLPVGSHTHSFNATDGELYADLGPINGPYIDDDPIIRVSIDSPSEGQTFRDDENITFGSSYSSNVGITDAEVVWASNISGVIGTSEDMVRMLEEGHHCITVNISSQFHGISDEAMVNITVIHEEPPVIHPLIIEYPSETEIEVDEGKSVRLGVEVNLLHPLVLDGEEFIFNWCKDDEPMEETRNFTVLSFSYMEWGYYQIVLNLSLGEELFQLVHWNISVNDIPAPIDIIGDLPGHLGNFEPGDEIVISLALADRESRDLSAVWTVDEISLDETNISFSLLLGGGTWAHEGDHSLKAVVTNPDGTMIDVSMTYTIVYPDIGDDDDEIDDDEDPIVEDPGEKDEKIGPGGIVIIVIGSTALLAGVAYGIYALAAPVEKKKVKLSEEVMDWNHPVDDGSRSGSIKGSKFTKLPPPPRFPGGGL